MKPTAFLPGDLIHECKNDGPYSRLGFVVSVSKSVHGGNWVTSSVLFVGKQNEFNPEVELSSFTDSVVCKP